ncbi:cell-cycle control medial ring component-domain-containing protein [Plectosphaerella cucumerina]|uniref:Cell-cycle control medial ring component-domain-containing protein n=1 Tax=Plectosphaerella cucumerina TaxID=40658 RepID=A0A8K0T5W2_9PEZI|nr:cell-cycle control medial ring component-domain-containing protein [Plectosphaerella cucumerina]
MAEIIFARNFLSTLESKPRKLSPDHVEDPKNFPARTPQILPKMPKSFSRPQNLAPGQERSVTVQLKSLRNPPIDLKLTSQPLNTSVLDLKLAVSERTRIPTEKLKLLHKKKPVADSKVLKELAGEEEKLVDFSIMVIGGAAAVPTDEEAQAAVETQPTGAAALETDHFWGDLKGFLTQRLKDEKEADELTRTWRADWQSKR